MTDGSWQCDAGGGSGAGRERMVESFPHPPSALHHLQPSKADAYGVSRRRWMYFLILCCPTQTFAFDSRSISVASIW